MKGKRVEGGRRELRIERREVGNLVYRGSRLQNLVGSQGVVAVERKEEEEVVVGEGRAVVAEEEEAEVAVEEVVGGDEVGSRPAFTCIVYIGKSEFNLRFLAPKRCTYDHPSTTHCACGCCTVNDTIDLSVDIGSAEAMAMGRWLGIGPLLPDHESILPSAAQYVEWYRPICTQALTAL